MEQRRLERFAGMLRAARPPATSTADGVARAAAGEPAAAAASEPAAVESAAELGLRGVSQTA